MAHDGRRSVSSSPRDWFSKSFHRRGVMQNNGVWAAISAEIRSGECTQRALESLQNALEQELLSADESEYLQEILAEAA
jgi:hypothetical protein